MKNKNELNVLLIAAGSIIFVDIVIPMLHGLMELAIVKMNQSAAKIQAVGAKDVDSIHKESNPSRVIGFAAPSEDIFENEECEDI